VHLERRGSMKVLARIAVFAFVILTLAVAAPVFAQTTGDSLDEIKAQLKQAQDAIKAQQAVIDGLQQRLATLEQAKAPAAPPAPVTEVAKAAPAEEKKLQPGQVGPWKISLGGTVFANYTYQLYTNPEAKNYDTADDFNAFDIQRCYIDFKGQNGPWAFRVTPDIYRPSDGSLAFRIKFSYLDYKFCDGATLRGGAIPTPWEAFTAPLYGYRYQGKQIEDRENYIPTADLGFGVVGKPNKSIEYAVDVVNGVGFTKPEVDKYKSFQGRVTFTPFEDTGAKGLGLSLYGEYGKEYGTFSGDALTGIRSRYIGMVHYKRGIFTCATEYMWTKDLAVNRVKYEPSLAQLKDGYANGQLWNAWFTIKLPSKWGFLVRYDHVNPSTDVDQATHWRGIAGISYDFNKYVALLLDEDYVKYEEGADMGTSSKQSNLSLHLQLLW
jgi:hypothetical protein